MNVLIVDDQKNIIDGIKEGVAWESIGVTRLLTACSATEAIHMISSHDVDLVVTDIEMPGMDGIELAKWISVYNEEIGIIFLTSHDDFDYARTAIKLKCCDYIIQPVDYFELQNALQKAVSALTLKNERDKIYENGIRWENFQKDIEMNCWQQIIYDESFSSPSGIQSVFQKIGYEIDWSQKYYLVIASLLTQKVILGKWQGKSSGAFLDTDIQKILGQDLPLVQVIKIDSDSRLCVFKECELLPWLQLWTAKKKHYYEIACYCSEAAFIYDLHKQYIRLKDLERQNIGAYSGVFQYRDQKEMQCTTLSVCEELSVENWKQKFLEHKGEEVIEEIRSYITRRQNMGALIQRQLFILQQMLLNAVYSLYNWDEKRFFHLLERQEIFDAYLVSANSVEDFFSFIGMLVENNDELLCKLANEDDKEELVGKIKMYISNHLDRKLDRQEIAEHFYLSKDHLTHIFKKYTGESIVQYINIQKLNKARNMLRSTNIPVNIIASGVGFSDYAYFSRLFKKEFGISAIEYRNTESEKSSPGTDEE